ncbi:MAG: winged helix-turn-helix transcriptional regulator [Nitrosarchaeum sp.]|nr:winged helix-turn-helix transcriptional regulator [Nitrosarchaeum sp.]
MPKPSEYQGKVREANRMNVLSFLKSGKPLRFKELKDLTKLSQMGLYKILKELEENKIIKYYHIGKTPVYEITKKGLTSFSETMTLGIIMDQIQKEDGEYHRDYFRRKTMMETQGLTWGIQDDIVINKDLENKIQPLLIEIIKNIHNTIYQNTKDISKIKDIDSKNIKNKKIVLGLIIEYDELIKSINENSLEIYQNIIKKQKYPKNKFQKASEELSELEKI